MSRNTACAALVAWSIAACAGGPVPLRGDYTWGHEVETFQPCGSKQVFWVIGDTALLQPLREQAAERARVQGRPYQPVYIEGAAVPEGKAGDGFAADYDGVYRFTAARPGEAGCGTRGMPADPRDG